MTSCISSTSITHLHDRLTSVVHRVLLAATGLACRLTGHRHGLPKKAINTATLLFLLTTSAKELAHGIHALVSITF